MLVNYSTGIVLKLKPEEGKSVAACSGLSIPFRMPPKIRPKLAKTLTDHCFLIAQKDFPGYQEAIRERLSAAFRNTHGLIIMPTEKCNFRCTYCYESFARGRMAPKAARAVTTAIRNMAAKAPSFSLGFFGGEPLLCHDLVVRFSSEALEVMMARNLPYAASVTTNAALLKPALFQRLLNAGVVAYQITIDGSRELHDRQRVSITGKGTFDHIVANLGAMAATDHAFHCVVRCNAHLSNLDKVLDCFLGKDLQFIRDDPRFSVDLQTIWESDQKEVHSSSQDSSDSACMSSLIKHLDYYSFNQHLEKMGIKTLPFSHMASVLGNGCYAGKPNWFVIGSNLKLYKCTVAFENEDNHVGKVALDGSLVVDPEKNRLWTGSNALTDSGCASCYLRVPCGGIACPLTRFTSGTKTCLSNRAPRELQQWAAAACAV